MLDKIKQLYELKQKTEQIKRELEQAEVEVVEGDIKIVITGAQKIKKIELADSSCADKVALEAKLQGCVNSAIKKSQELAAKKMQEITGFNLPGF